MMPQPRASLIAVLAVMAGFITACEKQTGVPAGDSASADESQKLPFDREPGSGGISPSNSFVPTLSKLPAGTPITIRLRTTVSSSSSNAGDSFTATVEDPVLIEGQTAIARGSAVTGRVLAAKASGSFRDPGYLRIALVSLSLDGKTVAIETSSIFAKAGSRDKQSSFAGSTAPGKKEVSFDADRRLTFRLAETVDFH